jgi:hypothetical protein
VSSGATMAVMDVTKKHKTIHWNSVSCAEFMRTTKFHKYYFSNQPDSRMQATGLAKYIVDKMGKKIYIFYTVRHGTVRRPAVQDRAREARRRGGRRRRHRRWRQGPQPPVRRHQPVGSRRAVPRLRRHRLARR